MWQKGSTFLAIVTPSLMYFSGSEFHNKLLAMSGIFIKQKKWFRKEDKHIGSNRKQIFFWSKS